MSSQICLQIKEAVPSRGWSATRRIKDRPPLTSVPPSHLAWLVETSEIIQTSCGLPVGVWELRHEDDPAVLSAWAAHFRRHYCTDELLPLLIAGTGKTPSEYLIDLKFPDKNEAPGPSIRSGDFAEILLTDYLEYIKGYWCPRQFRFDHKAVRNESTKGCDVIGFRIASGVIADPKDQLFIFESKAGLVGKPVNRLQDAVNDSIKDIKREGQSLNALKQRLFEKDDQHGGLIVQRFQQEADRPFQRYHGAAALLSDEVFDKDLIEAIDAAAHPNHKNLKLIAIRGASLMKLVHALYERAADEA